MLDYSPLMFSLIHTFWWLLIFTAILFFISGLDEVFFDAFFWTRYLYRKFKTKKYKPLTYEKLVAQPEKKIAILIPCWHEQNVIAEMLIHNTGVIDYANYDIFVGVYPNDPATIAAVKKAAHLSPHIITAIGKTPGPTNKAENLNTIYEHLLDYEKKHHCHYDILIFHDSEDLIHPLSLKLFNYLIPRKDMIQLPVFPLEVPLRNFTHWVYNDEFAENHTKNIIVRETIKGLVPSAGVATAFSRSAIDYLAKENNGLPFSTKSFTEDYDTALRIRLAGLKQIFVSRTIRHTENRKKWGFFGKMVPKKVNEYIAARALFPTSYSKSIRQKARWVMGISMQEWTNVGWPGDFPTRYTLLHDRKTLITHFINILGYIVFGFWLIYSFWQRYHPTYPTLQEFLDAHKWVWYLIIACTLIMLERLLQRMIAVYRIYGFMPALLSLPRAVYGNFINMHALLRAYWQYFIAPLFHRKRKWEKTDHTFPTTAELKTYKKKLGDLLVEEKLISKKQLTALLSKQMQTGDKLGALLLEKKYITEKQLLNALAKQYDLPIANINLLDILTEKQLPKISAHDYRWLLKNELLPIALKQGVLTIATRDPANDIHNPEVIKHTQPYQIKFALTSLLTKKSS